MRKKKQRATKQTCIILDARLTIVQAVKLHRELVAGLATGGPVVVDGSCVEEIDTAILQLLVSLWRTGSQRGIVCAWQGASDVLRKTAALLGLDDLLHFPNGNAEST